MRIRTIKRKLQKWFKDDKVMVLESKPELSPENLDSVVASKHASYLCNRLFHCIFLFFRKRAEKVAFCDSTISPFTHLLLSDRHYFA